MSVEVVPKETFPSFEDDLQTLAQNCAEPICTDDYMHTIQPIDIYAPLDIIYTQPNADDIYGVSDEFNTLVYDVDGKHSSNRCTSPSNCIENTMHFVENTEYDNTDTEFDSDDEVPDTYCFVGHPDSDVATPTKQTYNPKNRNKVMLAHSDIQISTFVCTQLDRRQFYLAYPYEKVKKTWYKSQIQYEPKINPDFAIDHPSYCIVNEIKQFTPNTIHAAYLHAQGSLQENTIFLNGNSTVTAITPTGLKLHTLFDTGCHKVLLSKAFVTENKSKFEHFYKVPFQEQHDITVGNGDKITATDMISLPVEIQGKHFVFLALIVDILEDYDFIIGLEAMMQLDGLYDLPSQQLHIQTKSVPLYPHKDISIAPHSQGLIHFSGKIPCSFTSGQAVIHVAPTDNRFSYITLEATFIDQTTSFHITNDSSQTIHFPQMFPAAFLDLRSIGYEPNTNPECIFHSTTRSHPSPFLVTSFASTAQATCDQPRDTRDPYPWLDHNDPRRFQTDRQILESAIDLSESSLTRDERIQFYDVLEEYKDAFSLRDEIGLAPNFQVHLELKDKTPFFIRPFAVKENMKQHIDKEMARLVNLGILKKGLSGYSSPVFAIPRKNSDIPRIVSDFRVLNTKLVTLNHSFTLIRDVIQAIGASQCEVMSVIDLRDAYHTLRLAPDSQQYCGITPYYGADTYIYQRLAMGLSVSPSIWQSFINSVLANIPNRNRYIAIMDDCLIFSKFQDHLEDLINLFKNLISHGLKISPRKCQFFHKRLTYMGMKFLIDKGRPSLTPLKDKCESIRNLQAPKNVKDCRKFCGMVNFLGTFLPKLQETLVPIYNLTRRNVAFHWSDECQQAFDKIKTQLTKPPIIRMPDLVGLFCLMSDTSKIAAGAALYQKQQGKFYIVGYNSKQLPKAAANYSATELELFGLTVNIFSFKTVLTDTFFNVFVDHSALKHLLVSKHPCPTRRIERLILKLRPFNFTIQHLAGEKMHIADILSRLAGTEKEPPDRLIPISFTVATRSSGALTPLHSSTSHHKKSNQSPSVISAKMSTPQSIPVVSSKPKTNPKSKDPRPHKKTRLPPTTPKPLQRQKTPLQHTKGIRTIPPPVGILQPKPNPNPLLPTSDNVKRTLINPNLQIPATLPPLDLPPPLQETLETYRPPDSTLYNKPKPVLQDFQNLDVFTRHIPKQEDIDKFLQVLQQKMTKSYELSVTATELAQEYPHSSAFQHIYKYIVHNVLPRDKRTQRMVIANAESYIVANNLLFKMVKPTKGIQDTIQFLLVIPEKFEHAVFHMFHDSLLGAHYNPINTYYTIKQRFWMHNLFEKLQRYIASCEACQKQKQKRGPPRHFHPRIPLEYNPMAYLSADIKYMPKGIYGYEFLLIAVCEVTGFTVAIPLVAHDAVTIAHAMLDRIFLIFGPPKTLIIDEDRALSAKVMHYILDALKVKIKCISPSNHGSLKTERYIQTLNNLITRHLKRKGFDWPLYVTSVCFAMNTFVSPTTGFSPYELVFLKKPPDILNLYFTPLAQIAKGYRDYCLKMRAHLENISDVVTEIKTFQQQRQAQEQHLHAKAPQLFQPGQLVYLLAPSAASLQTNTTKCRADYVGPLVVNRVLDETHYILNDLQGSILCGVYHINRLKKAELHTSNQTVSTYQELQKVFNASEQDAVNPVPLPEIAPGAALQSYFQLNLYRSSPIHKCNCSSSFVCICI